MIMKKNFTLNLKEHQLEVINYLKKKFSISSNKEMVNKCIKSALYLNKNDLIFSPIKENCRGGCFASVPQFEIDIKEDVFVSLFFNTTSKSKINLDYLFHKYYAGFEPKILQTESKEIIPFLELLSVLKARQASRPEYFSQSLASSLSIGEVEDIWSCISERDDWTKFKEKIKIIKNYATALRV